MSEFASTIDLETDLTRLEADADATQEVVLDKPDEVQIDPVDMFRDLLTPLSVIVVPNWKLTADEIDKLSFCYGSLLNKYFPDVGSALGLEFVTVMATLSIIGPRLMIPRIAPAPAQGETPADE